MEIALVVTWISLRDGLGWHGWGAESRTSQIDLIVVREVPAMGAEANKAFVRRLYQQLDAGELDVIDAVFSPTCVMHYPCNVKLLGPQGYKDSLSPFLTGLPDFEHTIEDLIATGEKVVARFKITTTHKGELLGLLIHHGCQHGNALDQP
jgi:predicted ester cyclase